MSTDLTAKLEALYACSAELHKAYLLFRDDDQGTAARLQLCAIEVSNAIGKLVVARDRIGAGQP